MKNKEFTFTESMALMWFIGFLMFEFLKLIKINIVSEADFHWLLLYTTWAVLTVGFTRLIKRFLLNSQEVKHDRQIHKRTPRSHQEFQDRRRNRHSTQ